jgi:ElaB/YqjD/DUF883 family membrane-anchored ribosome-binding protein
MATSNSPSEAGGDALKKDVSALKSDVSALTRDIGKLTRELFGEGKDQANGALEAAKERASELTGTARDNAQGGKDALVNRVQQKPLTSIAVAAGVGFALSMLTRR